MRTRRVGDDAGTEVQAMDGSLSERPCACPPGTTIEVRDLFFNVPARLKFQKGESARTMAIADTVRRTALSNPSIHFLLKSGTRTVADFLPCGSLLDRAAMVLGVSGRLHPFFKEREGVSVNGVLAAPDASRGDASRTVILVNGRPVNDVSLRRVMAGAFSNLIPQGRFPVAVADIRVEPGAVDVNVHPQKHEVRFRDPRQVQSLLYEAMLSVIDSTPWIAVRTDANLSSFNSQSMWPPVLRDVPAVFSSQDGGLMPPAGQVPLLAGLEPDRMPAIRYLGQVGNAVLVCEQGGSLVLIDQHAAHERINFNSLWDSLEAGEVPSDVMVFPEIVSLDQADMERFDTVREAMERLGFDLERYSGNSVAVRAVPVLLKGRAVDAIVREAVHAASELAGGSGDSILKKIVSTVACHASVRAGDVLSDIEARTLLASMEGVARSSYCPHGRQAVVVHPLQEILKSFDR